MVVLYCRWLSSEALCERIETTHYKNNLTNMVVSIRLAKNTQGYSTTEYL